MSKTSTIDVRDLLKAGAHFGHKVSHWNPKMRPYIYTSRGGIYIIDLFKTADKLAEALNFIAEVTAHNKQILFVATKRHLKEPVKAAAQACTMPYVTERWFGGTLTNFATISKRVKHLRELEENFASGKLAETYSKRELGEVKVEMAKLNVLYGGLKTMTDLPGALFCADVITDQIAVREANRLSIPVIGIVDTNSDPSLVTHPIPANDDAVSSVALISNLVAEAAKHGASLVRKVATESAPKPSPKSKAKISK